MGLEGIEDSNLTPPWNLGHWVHLEGLPMMSWGEVNRRDLVHALEMVRSIMKQLKRFLFWGTTVKLQFWLYVAELRTQIIFHF